MIRDINANRSVGGFRAEQELEKKECLTYYAAQFV